MSRSNGSSNQPGAWPPSAQPNDPATQPGVTQSRRQPQPAFQQPHDPYAQPAPQPYYYPSAQPSPAPSAGYGAPQPHPQAYAPQFDPYVPPTQPPYPDHQTGQHAGHGAQGQYAQPGYGQQGQYAPAPYAPAYDAPPAHGQAYAPPDPQSHSYSFEQTLSQLQPQRGAPAPAMPAASGYDHGYAAAPDPRTSSFDPYQQQWQVPQNAAPAGQHDPRGYDAGQHHQLPAVGHGPHGVEPHFDASGYANAPGGQQHPQLGYEQQQGGALELGHEHEHEDTGEFDYEEAPRSRKMLIAAALVGAIAVGGGMAYGYKTFFPGKTEVATPLVKGDSRPTKVKPSEPGGKQFSHTDSKIMGKLGDAGATKSAAAETDPSGTRKVQTMMIGRDGTVTMAPAAVEPPGEPAAAAPPVAAPAVAVPGVTMVDGLNGRPAAAGLAPVSVSPPVPTKVAAVEPPQPAIPAPTRPATRVVQPPVETAATTAVAPPAAKAPKAPVPKKSVTAAVSPKPTGAGYMAVLASVPATQKSRMDALKQWADMQQKYGTALANKTPDVQEANLGEKGVYHRLLAGPPGSREQASALCSQLKAAGYSGCWVTAY